MTETLPRKIADAKIVLDPQVAVKEFPSLNAKDFVTKLFGTNGLITTITEDYKNSITGFATNASGKATQKQPPKYLIRGVLEVGGYPVLTGSGESGEVDYTGGQTLSIHTRDLDTVLQSAVPAPIPSLILLHNAMILRPFPYKLNTTLDSTVTQAAGKGSKTKYGTGANKLQNDKGDKYTFSFDNMTFMTNSGVFYEKNDGVNAVTEIVRSPQPPNLASSDKPSDRELQAIHGVNAGINLTDSQKSALMTYQNRLYAKMGDGIRQAARSKFKLKKNQPFFIRTRMHKMSEAQLGYAKSANFMKNDWAQFYPDHKALSTALEIEWGSGEADGKRDTFKLIIRADGLNTVELYKKEKSESGSSAQWKMVEQPLGLPNLASGEKSEAAYKEITIYPLGRDLIICSGVPSTQSTLNKQYVRFSFNRFVNIDESTVKVYFYGGETYFSFQPITHVEVGGLLSPPISTAFNINGNGQTVEEGRYYLKVDYEGKFNHDYIGSVSSTAETNLPIPHPSDQGIEGSGGNSVDSSKGTTLAKRSKDDAFFGYLNGFVSLSKKVIRNNEGGGGGDSPEGVFYDGSKNKASVADNQFKYLVTLRASSGSSGSFSAGASGPVASSGDSLAPNARIYSPFVYKIEFHADPPILRVNLNSNPEINKNDLLSVELRQTVQGITGTATLWNRRPPEERNGGGIYTYEITNPRTNFTGVKPVVVTGGIINATSHQLRGFITSRTYRRPSAAESYVDLTLDDASKRAKDQMSINLPIFDGWGHLAVMYYLAKEVGYLDNQLLFYQNPRNENDRITIREVIEAGGGNCDTRQGGCFAGHVPKFPQAIGPAARVCKLPPSTIYACMPCNAFREQPAYMFQMGRPIWDCMNEVRNFSGWFLYANHFGSIIYTPAEAVFGISNVSNKPSSDGAGQEFTDAGGGGGSVVGSYNRPSDSASSTFSGPKSIREFGEVSGAKNGGKVDPLAYDQFKRNLQVTYGTDHVRNAVMAQSMIQSAEDPTNPVKYTPITVVEKQKGWPHNVNDSSYVPWPRWIIARSPYWNDLPRLQANTKQRLARAIAPRITIQHGAWGHAGLFPYDIVTMREDQAREVGIDKAQVIVQEVVKKWDASQKSFMIDVTTEYVDFNTFEWSPHENQNGAVRQSAG